MKRLSLLRHAKSSWDSNARRDFDRPLNARGREAAARMGAYIEHEGLLPDLILCSAALRTRETLSRLGASLDGRPNTEFRDDLYLADPRAMLAAIRAADPAATHILVIGHNPGTEMLALDLCDPDRSDMGARERIAEKFPTAALAYFEGPDHWRHFDKATCALKTYVTPKQLSAKH